MNANRPASTGALLLILLFVAWSVVVPAWANQTTNQPSLQLQHAFAAVSSAEANGVPLGELTKWVPILNQVILEIEAIPSLNSTEANLVAANVSNQTAGVISSASAQGQISGRSLALVHLFTWILVPVETLGATVAILRANTWHQHRRRRKLMSMIIELKGVEDKD